MDAKNYKQQLLDQLYAPYKKCLECPLGSMGRLNVVFGHGNPDAQLMFIGEGPGRDEDIQGKPFVGRSGQLLTRILEGIGINREDVFITNIVKCRPPDNRKPFPIESSTCKKLLLEKQIKIIRPQVICTLGASAVEGLLDTKIKITQVRGSLLTYQQITLIPTYHPAYILRNQSEIRYLIQDINKAFELAYPDLPQ